MIVQMRLKTLAEILIILPLVLMLGQCAVEIFAADDCIEAGYLYDYVLGACRFDFEHIPDVPHMERSWWLLTGAGVSMLVGLAFLFAPEPKVAEQKTQ